MPAHCCCIAPAAAQTQDFFLKKLNAAAAAAAPQGRRPLFNAAASERAASTERAGCGFDAPSTLGHGARELTRIVKARSLPRSCGRVLATDALRWSGPARCTSSFTSGVGGWCCRKDGHSRWATQLCYLAGCNRALPCTSPAVQPVERFGQLPQRVARPALASTDRRRSACADGPSHSTDPYRAA